MPQLLALLKLDTSASPLLHPAALQPLGVGMMSMPLVAHSHLPHILQLAGCITPPGPTAQSPSNVSPNGGVISHPVAATYGAGATLAAANTTAVLTHPTTLRTTTGIEASVSKPMSSVSAPAGASAVAPSPAPASFSGPSYVPASDYFSYRSHVNAPPAVGVTSASGPPLHYGLYGRNDLVLLLLESILRMLLANNVVHHAEQSPVPPHHRLNLFSQESSYHPIQHVPAYSTSMGPILYAPTVASYGPHVPQQSAVRGGSTVAAMAPVGYGVPQLGQTVLQPYSILVASPYSQVVGPGPAAGAGAMPEETTSKLVAEQNFALLNKRRIIKRRTRTGCLTCRKRRIKCDERKPHCFNCERLKKLCLGYEVLPSPGKHSDSETEGKTAACHRSSVHDLL